MFGHVSKWLVVEKNEILKHFAKINVFNPCKISVNVQFLSI
jgi:hypothetical protein